MFLPIFPISLINRSIIVHDFPPSRLLIVLKRPLISISIRVPQYPLDDISIFKNTRKNASIMKKIFTFTLKMISLPVSCKHILVRKLIDALSILFVVLVDFPDVNGRCDVLYLDDPIFEGGFGLIAG